MIVVDASVLVDLLIGRPGSAAISDALRLRKPWHAPHLVDLEVCQALRRLVLQRMIGADRARGAVDNLQDMDVARHAHFPFVERIWELRHEIAAYDAAYVALAEALGVPLVTRDARLANSGSHTASIESV